VKGMDHTITRKLLAFGMVAGLALALTACGDDDDDTASGGGSTTTENEANEYGDGSTTTAGDSSGGSAEGTLQVTSIQYSDVSAPAGGTLEIDNSSGAAHTFTSDNDAFESVDVASDGTTDAQVPSDPGEYPFHCEIHPSMQATLTVQ
jgi:plastocyanin